jgi:5-methylcytosine-specific restriction endonuclease McrA
MARRLSGAARKHDPRHKQKQQQAKKYRGYIERNKLLEKLGYPTYQEYLASPLWAVVRARVMQRDGWACRLCSEGKRGKGSLQVHHSCYDKATLLGWSLKHLYTICRKCHDNLEHGRDGEKRALKKVAKITRKLVRRQERREVDPSAPRLEPPDCGTDDELTAAGEAVKAAIAAGLF